MKLPRRDHSQSTASTPAITDHLSVKVVVNSIAAFLLHHLLLHYSIVKIYLLWFQKSLGLDWLRPQLTPPSHLHTELWAGSTSQYFNYLPEKFNLDPRKLKSSSSYLFNTILDCMWRRWLCWRTQIRICNAEGSHLDLFFLLQILGSCVTIGLLSQSPTSHLIMESSLICLSLNTNSHFADLIRATGDWMRLCFRRTNY